MDGGRHSDRADRAGPKPIRDRGEIRIKAEHPRHVVDALGPGGPGGEFQHVRFWIDADRSAHPGSQGQSELTGAATEVDHEIFVIEIERFDQCIDNSGWVSATELRVVLRNLTENPRVRSSDICQSWSLSHLPPPLPLVAEP